MSCGTCAENAGEQTRNVDGIPDGTLRAIARVIDFPLQSLRRAVCGTRHFLYCKRWPKSV